MSTGDACTKNIAGNSDIIDTPKFAWVYLLHCADDTFYCGSTTDLYRRVHEHNTSDRGARYTSGRRPVKLVYCEKYITLSEALKREYMIKQMSRVEKMSLISV